MGYEGQFKSELRAGFVYVLTCPRQPGLIRIGSTLRDIGKTRYERFGTVEPTECEVAFAVHVPDRQELERALQKKFAHALRSAEEHLYAASADEVISAAVAQIGFGYTNAPITAVLFKKQIEALRKREADLRKHGKSLAVMSEEASELRRKMHGFREDIAAKDEEISWLTDQVELLSRQRKKSRLLSILGGSASLALFVGIVALSLT